MPAPALVPRFDRGLARLDFAPDAKLSPGTAPAQRDPVTGYVRARAYLARDGLLTYGDHADSWQEIRPREELERAAITFANAPLTDLHPDAMVTADTWEDVSRGHVIGQPYVTEPDADGVSYLAAELLITSTDMIETIDAGQVELSIGFWTRAVDAPEGSGARYAQVDLLGNHVASVPRGRAGPACRVILDHAATCAYDSRVSDQRTDLEAVEMQDYQMPDGTVVQAPTPLVQLLASYEGKIAELTKAASEPDEPDMSENGPDDETQPGVPPAPAPAAPPAPEPEDEDRRDASSVRVDRASAEALIVERMPHMAGKLDGLDLDTLFACALATPAPAAEKPRADAATENPFAESAQAQPKRDSRDIAPIANYLTAVLGSN